METLEQELQKIYNSGINVTIWWMCDAGIEVALGNEYAGYDEEGTVQTVAEVVPWLQDAIARHYPDSRYNAERLGSAWSPKPEDFTRDKQLMREALIQVQNERRAARRAKRPVQPDLSSSRS